MWFQPACRNPNPNPNPNPIQVQSQKHDVWRRAEETGATVVSDGAKLSTRKRAMLNTSLALPDGLEFLQQTDATGRRKDARFLADDQSKALERCGTVTQERNPEI